MTNEQKMYQQLMIAEERIKRLTRVVRSLLSGNPGADEAARKEVYGDSKTQQG